MRCSRSAVGVRSVDIERTVRVVDAQAAGLPTPLSAVVGGAWLTVVGCSMRKQLAGQRTGSAAMGRVTRIAGQHLQRGGAGEDQRAHVPVAPLGIPVRMSFGTSPSAIRMTRLSVGVLM
jgi:hypothetical protein